VDPLAAIIVNLGIFVVTTLAAIVAWKQTNVAMEARSDAQEARDSARGHEEAALGAAVEAAAAAARSAKALEERNRIALAALRKRDRWAVKRRSRVALSVINKSGVTALGVEIELAHPDIAEGFLIRTIPPSVAPGEYIDVRAFPGPLLPPAVHLHLRWVDANDGSVQTDEVHINL
jgi:hypothetical protein